MPALRHLILKAAIAITAAGVALASTEARLRAALDAEARLDTRRALELFLQLAEETPTDSFVLQKVARQYSDLFVDLPTPAEQREAIARALDYARRAVAVEPGNAENVLSVAICFGKLALLGSTSEKVRYSRLMREEADRALALDPRYAWAHHVLGRWHYEVAGLGATARWFVRLFYGGLPAASAAEAVRHLRRAVELEPGQLKHHLELGFAYLAAGDSTPARQAFAAGLAMPSREKHDEAAKTRARAALAELEAPRA